MLLLRQLYVSTGGTVEAPEWTSFTIKQTVRILLISGREWLLYPHGLLFIMRGRQISVYVVKPVCLYQFLERLDLNLQTSTLIFVTCIALH